MFVNTAIPFQTQRSGAQLSSMSIVGNIKLRAIQAREKRVEDSLAANVAPSFLPASSIG
jgi:hypothetical protein